MTAFRDIVMDALLAKLQAACGDTFKYYSRRFQTWEQMVANRGSASPIAQPALFLYDGVGFGGGSDKIEPRGRASPSVITMKRTIVVYAQMPGGGSPAGPDDTTPGSTPFNPLIETILNDGLANDSASQNTCTLASTAYPTGLVSHCWAEGEIMYLTPDIDPKGQGFFTVPISLMLYPNSA